MPRRTRRSGTTPSRHDAEGKVTGATWHDAKIGRDVEGRILLVPDPMGATGSSINSALRHYKTRFEGTPKLCITMHLIVRPEFIKNLLAEHQYIVPGAWA